MDIIKSQQLLKEAIEQPGKLLEAYTAFHNYSLGNRILAAIQCKMMGLQVGPIATFNQWKEKGRYVKKGSKAISLCMPITYTVNGEDDEKESFTKFVYKKNWFVLSQTEGKEYQPEQININWNKEKALQALNVTEIPFESLRGNAQGYSKENQVAINPIATYPLKTLFHELAHILLNHTQATVLADTETISPNLMEVEAEVVSLLCIESLGLEGSEYCRGYIQHYLKDNTIPEKSAQRIITTADKILKEGM